MGHNRAGAGLSGSFNKHQRHHVVMLLLLQRQLPRKAPTATVKGWDGIVMDSYSRSIGRLLL